MMNPGVFVTILAFVACGESEFGPAVSNPLVEKPASPASLIQDAPPPRAEDERASSQTTPGPIPIEFRHVWAIEVADCKRDPGLTRIAITPGAVKFYEGRAEIVSLEQTANDGVIMQVKHMAEGKTYSEVHHLKLNSEGTTLTYDRGGSSFTYTRCD